VGAWATIGQKAAIRFKGPANLAIGISHLINAAKGSGG